MVERITHVPLSPIGLLYPTPAILSACLLQSTSIHTFIFSDSLFSTPSMLISNKTQGREMEPKVLALKRAHRSYPKY